MTNKLKDFDDFLLSEREEFLNSHQNMTIIGHCCVALMTVTFLWDQIPHQQILIWASVFLSVAFVSFFSSKILHTGTLIFGHDIFLVKSVLTAIAIGFTWGMVPLIFFVPDSTTFLIIIFCIYTGYISSAISVSFAYSPVFIGFAAGITAPFAARLIYSDGYEHNFISIAIFVYVTILIYASRNIHQIFIRSTRSNFDKLSLLKELKAEKEVAIKANNSKSRFLAAASHDLRQPLNAVSLFVDVLDPLLDDKNERQILKKIRLSLKGLNKMLHGLLDISKLDAKAMENRPKHLNLSTLVKSLLNDLSFKTSHLTLTNELSAQSVVYSDPIILERIIGNVLENAIKYTHAGSVILKESLIDDKIILKIQDTGIGIRENQLGVIFDEFQQLNNPERNREQGLGLGLAIVKRLCALANIELKLISEFGKGTLVTLTIPKGNDSKIEYLPAEAQADLSNLLVIVIDDERSILEGMEKILLSWNCSVIIGVSKLEALDKLKQQNSVPDIIISDFRLQGEENGIDAIECIREEFNISIPAILITGDTNPDRISLAQNADCAVMYKPIESAVLNISMRNCLIT